MIKQFTCALVLFSIMSGCDDDARNTTEIRTDNPTETSVDKQVDTLVPEYFGKIAPGQMSIAVTKDGKTFYYNYCKESSLLPSNKSIYEIGSVSKTFTALLYADQIEREQISLDEPVSTYMEGHGSTLQLNGKQVTIRQLLTHTSGLPENPPSIVNGLQNGTLDPANPARNYTYAQLITDLGNTVLEHEPGTTYTYSNYGYAILGYILDQHAGKSQLDKRVDDMLRHIINIPDTHVILTSEQKNRVITGHASETKQAVAAWEMGDASYAGGLHSTASDLINYIHPFMGVKQVENIPFGRALDELFPIDDSQKIAYAWNKVIGPTGNVFWHNGETSGQRCFVAFYEDGKTGIVILSNQAEPEGSDELDVLGLTLLVTINDL